METKKKNLGLIHNFSDFTLPSHMISLLNRGPGFVPVQKSVDTSQIMDDLERYNRSVKWREYFSESVHERNIIFYNIIIKREYKCK